MPSKPAKIAKLQLTRETVATLRLRSGLRTGQAASNPPPPHDESADGCMASGTALTTSNDGAICQRWKDIGKLPAPPPEFRRGF